VSKLVWDAVGNRRYETGVDQGVLYIPDGTGKYTEGYAWNGLTKVTEKPTGATPNKQYANNQLYLNLLSTELFEADIEAFTYPDAWAQCDGSQEPEAGVAIGQQTRKTFGLSYRTRIGNDIDSTDFGYKIHLVYNALAAPSQKDFSSINDNPAATAFSWSVTTTPVAVSGFKPTATLTIDSTKVNATALTTLEDKLYGTAGVDPALPTPDEVLAIFSGTVTVVTATPATYDSPTHTITIPSETGVTYYIDGVAQVAGPVVITQDTVVVAEPNAGYTFTPNTVNEWGFIYP
jgi:hypothetical protein